ncbi:MAG TPA: GNAT family N-acetyltransferase [Terriglobales bacterium]
MRVDDVPELLCMMRELAIFERQTDFQLTEEELSTRGFGERPEFGAFVAEVTTDGVRRLAAYAAHYMILFKNDLHPTLVLKGLYVDPNHRKSGLGLRLMTAIARLALERDCGRAHWFVVNDNDSAAAFYRALGGTPDTKWVRWGLDLTGMRHLAAMGEATTAAVVAIHITSMATAPVTSVQEVRAVPGRGLEGDRYFEGTGTFSAELHGRDRELTD